MKRKFKLGMAVCLMAAFVFTGCKKDSDDKYSVTLSANNAEWGTVAGGGDYADGTEISIMATANSGYHFEKWSDDDTNNPRTLTVTKNIALIAVFAEGNGSGQTNNNGGSGNQQGSNNQNTSSKKISKIVEKYLKNSELRKTTTYLFDTEGRLTSKTRDEGGSYTDIWTYTYTSNQIVETRSGSDKDTEIFNIENGVIVSSVLTEAVSYVYNTTYTYSSDGYLASVVTTHPGDEKFNEEETFTFSNGNMTAYETRYVDSYDSYTSKHNFSYGSKPNNMNVDIALMLIDGYTLPAGSLGKQCQNLPSSYNKSDGEESHTGEYTYTYDGDCLTKIYCSDKSSDSKTKEYTWEIFYE